MAPPEGVVADLDNPKGVLRTVNFVTQALTLTMCSGFVLIRGVQKFKVGALVSSVDDCGLFFVPSLSLESGRLGDRQADGLRLADLTVLAWLFLVAYCIAGVFSTYLRTARRMVVRTLTGS